jgi:hypothetical protein
MKLSLSKRCIIEDACVWKVLDVVKIFGDEERGRNLVLIGNEMWLEEEREMVVYTT